MLISGTSKPSFFSMLLSLIHISPIELYLKTGAQVIFIKNDIEHQWVNGTLGTIIGLSLIHISRKSMISARTILISSMMMSSTSRIIFIFPEV